MPDCRFTDPSRVDSDPTIEKNLDSDPTASARKIGSGSDRKENPGPTLEKNPNPTLENQPRSELALHKTKYIEPLTRVHTC